MIYLTTGANGAGKTLLTLADVREKSIKENRPVYHNGRFEIVPGGPLDTWQKVDFKEWQSVPDGAIFVIDECHNEMPVRTGKDVPEYIRMLAEHRRRGFDFYFITQHPNNIDAFVRRLIGAPGWHRNIKRKSGAPLVWVLEWTSTNSNCEKPGAGEDGQITMRTYPREVYSWYVSTSLDTAKVKIPFKVKLLFACIVGVPVLAYMGWHTFQTAMPKAKTPAQQQTGLVAGSALPPQQKASSPGADHVLTAAEYVASFVPRVEGFQQTAPRYDAITKPTTAPYPAACVQMGDRCDCYTQQATKLTVPAGVCQQIVKSGFFMDWQVGPTPGATPVPQSVAAAAVQQQPQQPQPDQFQPFSRQTEPAPVLDRQDGPRVRLKRS